MTGLPVSDLAQAGTVRLIPSARLQPPALDPLADTEGERDDIAEIEGFTNARLVAPNGGLLDIEQGELLTPAYGWGHTYINAAFIYTRASGNRFNGPERGAWYAAFDVETSLAEVAYHLARELTAINRYDNETDYGELIADFIGTFHDARQVSGAPDYLHDDTAVAYPAGQRLAVQLRGRGSRGLIYPSVRHPGGTCIAVFKPSVVQNLRQGGMWRLTWRGRPEAEIVRV